MIAHSLNGKLADINDSEPLETLTGNYWILTYLNRA